MREPEVPNRNSGLGICGPETTMRTVWIAVSLLAAALAFVQQEQKTMNTKSNDGRMDYIEFPAADIPKAKAFYSEAFGWKFTDYGPDYTSFDDGRLAGGFNKEQPVVHGGVLVVLYASDLAATEAKVRAEGGKIVKDSFAFPGGRRFHFADPNGNGLAVWSEK
jgi:uncharacterized protein